MNRRRLRALLEREVERTERARRERDAALIRVVELEQAIRQFCRHHHDDELVEDRGEAKRRLCAVLDGHDRRAERDQARRYGYAEGMRWTCHQAGHPHADGLEPRCICGAWAHQVEAGAVEVDL